MSRRTGAESSGVQAVRPPYVSGAFLCERLLQEKDETISAIRIVDRFQIDGKVQVYEEPGVDISDIDLPFRLRFTTVVILRALPRAGTQTVVLQPFGPDGEPLGDAHAVSVAVTGRILGASLKMDTEIGAFRGGVHWISVSYRGRELTRITFDVEDRRVRERIAFGVDPDPGTMFYVHSERLR